MFDFVAGSGHAGHAVAQQKLDLSYQTNQLHQRIENQQAKLWSQQLRIATYTAPRALIEAVDYQQINLVAATPLPASTRIVTSDTTRNPKQN